MFNKSFYVLMLCFSLSFVGIAQDCFLGIGGKDTKMIEETFQLNDSQLTTMESLKGELEVQTKVIQDQIDLLLKEHPQSKEEDLIVMGDKYKQLQGQLISLSLDVEQKFLETFNAKQYERYLELCNAAYRRPIKAIPMEYDAEEASPE
ncbi:hypothetical protein [Euzebyella saccharophila]|uniref:Uncharacterized protein n=1 Tax=Euzebyella saccharophila TaxID=679664 RepID=A0ABV8JIR9_9FLAO|nr:hypothetical protein [Euzebyella saccharophila]